MKKEIDRLGCLEVRLWFLFLILGLLLGPYPVLAGSATWLADPASNDWNMADNWTPGGPPNGSTDVATFQFSAVHDVSISANTQVSGLTFSAGGATPYTIAAGPAIRLTISGLGITNDSGLTQNFQIPGDNGKIQFTNSASAGFGTAFTTNGGAVGGGVFGVTEFRDSSSAGSASFTTSGGTVGGAFGGVTQFFDSSTAGDGTFTADGGTVIGAGGGVTLFYDSSTAGNARITTNGNTVEGVAGGLTVFFHGASAGNATFETNGGFVSGAGSGAMQFFNSSTAGNGTFVTNGGAALFALGGIVQFLDGSTAGRGTFVTNGGARSGGCGGLLQFFNTSSAANGVFTTNGGVVRGELGGTTEFYDNSTAASATFITNGITVDFAEAGTTRFRNNSSAGSATFITNGGGTNGLLGGGLTQFLDSSNAGNATFVTNGATRSEGAGGIVEFRISSSAGNGTLITNGSAFRRFVCPTDFCGEHSDPSAKLLFLETATAANATLIANGGTNGGDGGLIFLGDDSTGGTARVEVFDNGHLDISGHNDPGVTIGSLEGTGAVFLGMNPLSVGSNNLNTTFSGVIQDGGISEQTGGSLTKIGSGTLTLSGDNTYTGDTTIDGGSVVLDGSIASANALISSLGVLAGTGIVGGNLINSGTVTPGDSGPGILRSNGNFTQSSTGNLQIEIGSLVLAQHDLLQVTGNATLGGNLQLIALPGSALHAGDKIVFLSAGGGVTGQFATVDNPFSQALTMLKSEIVYEQNDVALLFHQLSFVLADLTRNQEAVARNLDSAAADPRADALVFFLDNQPLENLPHAYDLLAPEELASTYEIILSQATVQALNLQRRLENIRAGSTGFSAAGYQMRDADGFSKSADGKTAPHDNSTPFLQPSADNRWGVFLTGTGRFVDVGDEDLNARGYDLTTAGFTLGVDYRVTSHLAVGLNAGYAHSDSALVDGGRANVDGGKLGVYSTYFSDGFYLDGAASGGRNSYDTRRVALLGDARGATNGGEFNALLGAGYDWNCAGLRFGPTATLRYTYSALASFSEIGSLAPLRFPDQSESSLQSALGIRVSHAWKMGRVRVRPEVRAAWHHQYGNRSYAIDSQFNSGAGNIFTVFGPETGRDSALISGGAALIWSECLSTSINYDGSFGRSNHESHSVSAGVRFMF